MPLRPDPKESDVAELFSRGIALEEEPHTHSEAISTYLRVIESEPTHAAAHINVGTLYYNRQDYGLAEKHYRAAIESDPRYALAYFDLGNVLDETGRVQEAIQTYNTALQLAPTYADAHYNLALAYEKLKQPRKALQHWRAYVKLDTTSPWAITPATRSSAFCKATDSNSCQAIRRWCSASYFVQRIVRQIGDRAFGCRADLVGKSFAAVRRRDQRPVGPARRNVVKIRLDSLWRWLEKLLLGPALREHVIEGWLQSLAAHGGADQILVLGCPVCTEFEFIVDYPQSVVFSVDTVHAAADRQVFQRFRPVGRQARRHVGLQAHGRKP